MSWSLRFSKRSIKQLNKMDKHIAQLLISWLDKHVNGCSNPRLQGKALSGELSSLWRYRIGNYRILCDILDEELVVIAIAVSHRKDIYKK